MLSAKRISDGETVVAYFEQKRNGPFRCVTCSEDVILKIGKSRVNHFAHANPFACEYATPESQTHLRCKWEIFEALKKEPDVSDVMVERPCGRVRPDVSAIIKGVKVAIEVQISFLSIERIMERTIAYHQKGIYVLWLLPWRAELDKDRYAPELWEKWLHACYFGRVYYWTHGLNVVEYRFEPHLRTIPKKSWYSENGKKMTVGGYASRSIRFRKPERGRMFNLAKDFGPKVRNWWEGGGVKVPDARLFCRVERK
jgi:competence protein CoiA